MEYQNFDGIGHCFSDAECTCGGFNAGFFGMLCCPANKEVTGNSQVLGVSASLYVGFGGEASLGLDLNTWLEEKHRIEEEFDNYCESWTWDE